MTASAATLTVENDGHAPGYKVKSFTTTLATPSEGGIEITLGWESIDACNIPKVSATPPKYGLSYQYSAGVMTIYGDGTDNALDGATIAVIVFGKD